MSEPWELPPAWEWAPFSTVAVVESNLEDPTDWPDAPHIAPNHIESGTGRLLEYMTVAEDGVTSPKHHFYAGQIIYSKIRPYLAKAVVVDFDGLCSADMYPVRSKIEPQFLHRWLVSPAFTELASKRQGRSLLPKINQKALATLPVPVPPLNEQRRIVAKIEALFARSRRAKEALDAIPPLLDRLRQSILAAAFRGDLTADWRAQHPDVEPADKLLERIRTERRRRWEEAELAKMRAKGKEPKNDKWKTKYQEPEFPTQPGTPRANDFANIAELGWSEVVLEAACDAERGIPYGIVQTGDETQGGIPTVRCGDIKGFSIDVGLLKRVDRGIEAKYTRTRLQGGEVLVAIRGTVGGTAIANDEMRGANISREVAMVPLLSGLRPRFVMYLLASPRGAAILVGHTKGVAQRGVNLSDLRSFPVPLPPVAEQDAIVDALDQAFGRLRRFSAASANAQRRMTTLDASVLGRAFSGDLVAQDPADEPATELLAGLEDGTNSEQSWRKSRPRATTPSGGAKRGEVRAKPEQLSLAEQVADQPELRRADDYSRERWRDCLLQAVDGEPLERDDAIRRAAEWARDNLGLEFKRLRADGKILKGLKSAMNSAIRRGELERVGSNKVRRPEAEG